MPNEEKRYNMLLDDDRQEAIRIKKMKQGLVSNTDNENYLKEKEEKAKTPMTFKEKLSNFWFHFKPVIIVSALIIGIVTYLVFQAANRETYDTTIMIHTNTYYSFENLGIIKDAFAKFMPDADGNGKIEIGILQSKEIDDQSGNTVMGLEGAMKARLAAEIASGKNCIFIVEDSLIDSVNQKGLFADLREVLGIEGDSAVYSIPLKDSSMFENEIFDSVRDKYHICLRVFKEDTDRKQYDYQLKAVQNIYNEIKN